MNIAKLLFHIAKQDGVEFVIKSGTAFSYPMHSHFNVYMVTVVRSGTLRLVRRDSMEICPAGSTYIIPPYEPHRASADDGFDTVSLCINKNKFHHLERSLLTAKALEYAQILMEQSVLSAETVQNLLVGIDEIYEEFISVEKAPTVTLDTLKSWAHADMENVSMIPADLSPFQFIRKVKSEIGITPHQYLLQLRIRKAKQLIESGMPIADAALSAGFYDQSHLNRLFSQRLGITPRMYQNSFFNLSS